MVKWWAGHVPPPHKTLLCFLLPQHTAGIPPKKTKRFHTIYRVRLDCRRKCIFLTCDYKAHVCSTQKTSGLTLSQLFMMHTACETLICIWSWRLIFYIENGSWVWSYPEIETCTFNGYSTCVCQMSCFSMCQHQHTPSTKAEVGAMNSFSKWD